MNHEDFEFDEWEDEDDVIMVQRAPKRYFRDQQNPFEVLREEEFKRRFRFGKETVVNTLLPAIFPDNMDQRSNRGLPIPPLMKIIIALRFYATSSFQAVCGDLFFVRVSQPTVHRIIKEVSEKIATLIPRYVKMPQTAREIADIKAAFYRIARFPGVVGLVDGTHIPIKSPGGRNAEVFRNRKGYFSINCQVVCGPKEEIFDIVIRWPGSAHDSRIFRRSAISMKMERDHRVLGHLLGDSGYAQKNYIFTPLGNAITPAEIRYNRSHKVTRSLVERTIGRWKRRFPCLYFERQTKLHNTLWIIAACAVLYNIGIGIGDLWDEDDGNNERPNMDIQLAPVVNRERAMMYRREFIIRHFT